MAAGPDLVGAVQKGNRLALARLISELENDSPAGHAALDALFSSTGKAYLIGVTGPPGAGKSSLVNQVAQAFRKGERPLTVGIIAIDPTSPFTGGALLGDRLRMRDLAGDRGVFIRSMATRGALGGLARTTAMAVQALDAAGYEVILIETVGAGQAEVDIARLAHTTLVVDAPGMGDDIQAIKAGILEIADILVINKADHPGIENTERALRGMLELGYHRRSFMHNGQVAEESEDGWVPPVLKTIAIEGIGINELVKAVNDHRAYLERSGEWEKRQQERLRSELELLIQATLVGRWRESLKTEHYQRVLEQVYQRTISPFQAVELLI